MIYYGNGQQLEYDFVVKPGADPGAIRLAFDGSSRASIDPLGDLVLETGSGGEEVRFRKPVVFQQVKRSRKEVTAQYALLDAHEVGFQVGSYDVGEPLVIDPILSYSTYLGGTSLDSSSRIAVDGVGKAYVTGSTQSFDFPTASPFQPFYGGVRDGFVSKISDGGPARPTITSVDPGSGAQGTTINVKLAGANFTSGSTAVAMSGTGISVGAVNVTSPSSLTAVFSIASSATLGTRAVSVTTPGGTAIQTLTLSVAVNPLFPGNK